MSDTFSTCSDLESATQSSDHPNDDGVTDFELEQSSKAVIQSLKREVRALEERKQKLKSYFSEMMVKPKIFKGIQSEIMLNKPKPRNTLSCGKKILSLSAEIIQEIVGYCDIDERIVLSLVSKEMALQVDRVDSLSKLLRIAPKATKTELQRLRFLLRLDDWMGARRLCFKCLRYKSTQPKFWYTKKGWTGDKWEGGVVTRNIKRLEGPMCRACAVKGKLQRETAKQEVLRLKSRIDRL